MTETGNTKGKHLANMAKEMFGTDQITTEQLTYLTDMLKPSTYMLRNHSVRGHPMTFSVSGHNTDKAQSHRPWQIGILNDPHKNIAIMKSRQLGMSELGVGKMMHFADTYSYSSPKCLYTFPTHKAVNDFVKSRLNPLLENGYYKTITDPDANSLEVKKIRNSYMYFRTSSKPGSTEGVDIDYLSLDEYDRVNYLAENSALESMSSSPFHITNRWSTPSAPDIGIDRLYQQSDQHIYLHKCEHCGFYNEMSFDDYLPESSVENRGNILCVNPKGVDPIAKTVVDGSFQFVCQKCGNPLDRWYNGYWVAKFPERTQDGGGTRGYKISQMNAVWISADNLKRKELEAISKQSFWNYALGQPYLDLKLAVTQSDIEKHVREDLPEQQFDRGDYAFISVGIDFGNRHSLVIHGVRKNGLVDYLTGFTVGKSNPLDPESTDSDIQAIRVKLAPYDPDIIVADVGDSGDKIAKLIQIYGKDKVYGCVYPSVPRSTGNILSTWNEQGNKVSADKLTQNKRYISMIKDGDIGYYRKPDESLHAYVEHWKNVIIRDVEDDKSPSGFRQEITRKGPDHFAQASVYSMLGWERLLNVFNGNDEYGLNFDWMDSQMTPTQPDIFSQFT